MIVAMYSFSMVLNMGIKYCKPTFFCDLLMQRWFAMTNVHDLESQIQTRFVTTTRRHCSEKYSRRGDPCEPHENFSHVNKSLFTVLNTLMCDLPH